uniref:Uncharacterized protein n=1 Tax=Romanomermis culicivorax TaxID=13658 RepID=A0A915J7V8_ROMCU
MRGSPTLGMPSTTMTASTIPSSLGLVLKTSSNNSEEIHELIPEWKKNFNQPESSISSSKFSGSLNEGSSLSSSGTSVLLFDTLLSVMIISLEITALMGVNQTQQYLIRLIEDIEDLKREINASKSLDTREKRKEEKKFIKCEENTRITNYNMR